MIDTTRTPAPPASLANKKTYEAQDVRRSLYADFMGKCYLCEGRLTSPANMEVDHRRPKADPRFSHLMFDIRANEMSADIISEQNIGGSGIGASVAGMGPKPLQAIEHRFHSLRYEWANLFPAHPDCNKRRPGWPATGALISPGDPATPDLERRIGQRLECGKDPWVRFYANDPADTDAENTAKELRHIHIAESGNANSKWKARDLREAVHLLAMELSGAQKEVYRLERDGKKSSPEWSDAHNKVRTALSRRSPFTALLRSIADLEFHPLFD